MIARHNRLPVTPWAKLGHFLAGAALGAMVAALTMAWLAGG